MEKDVVQRGSAQRDFPHGLRRTGPGPIATGPITLDPSSTLNVISSPWTSTLSTPRTRSHARAGPLVSPSTLATITSEPMECFRSAGAPSATILPWSIMPTRWARWSASSRYCVVRKIVTPLSRLTRRTSSQTFTRLMGSSPVVGSSRKRICGSWISAAARSSLLFMPPE